MSYKSKIKQQKNNKMMGKSLEKSLSKRTYPNSDNHMKRLFKTLVISEIEAQP